MVRRCIIDDVELIWRTVIVIAIICFVLFLAGNPVSLLWVGFVSSMPNVVFLLSLFTTGYLFYYNFIVNQNGSLV